VADLHYVLAPKEAMGDDHIQLVEWIAADGVQITRGTVIALGETTKAAFEIFAQVDGFLFHLIPAGERVAVGAAIAVISPDGVRPAPQRHGSTPAETVTGATFTSQALQLLEQHGIPKEVFAASPVVRSRDVEAYIRRTAPRPATERYFGDEPLPENEDWDEILRLGDFVSLQQLLTRLRRRLKARFNRHVPLGTLLHDRWDVAREYRFGEGTSVYDECLILGDVVVGKHCWVGPFTILDGNFASLRIGDYTSIGSGSHVYTHHSIDHAITRGRLPIRSADTLIGEACFISPMVIVGPGSKIGDHSFVASGSVVQGEFKPYSYVAGVPARRVGRVEVRADHVVLIKDDHQS
jgi:acetyltransferase-like isoleucine patch superfamily enzyme